MAYSVVSNYHLLHSLTDNITEPKVPEYVVSCQRILDEIDEVWAKFETEAEKKIANSNMDDPAKVTPRKIKNIMVFLSRADLKWPLSKSRTSDLMKVLERHKTTCILALSENEMYASSTSVDNSL